MLVLVFKMNTSDSTSEIFAASRWHELHSRAFDLRHVTSSHIRWHLSTDLRLLYLFLLGIENITLTIFLFRIRTKHAHHLVGYTLYAAWAPTICASSLTDSQLWPIFVFRSLIEVLDVGDVENATAESLRTLINFI